MKDRISSILKVWAFIALTVLPKMHWKMLQGNVSGMDNHINGKGAGTDYDERTCFIQPPWPECSIWMGPSSLPGVNGFGIYTTRNIAWQESILNGQQSAFHLVTTTVLGSKEKGGELGRDCGMTTRGAKVYRIMLNLTSKKVWTTKWLLDRYQIITVFLMLSIIVMVQTHIETAYLIHQKTPVLELSRILWVKPSMLIVMWMHQRTLFELRPLWTQG